jgi:7-cyano-7-deazaguanine reductase
VNAKLPEIEVFENQYPDYEITITLPEYTAICPKTKLPDFGVVTIRYTPKKYCAELKSLKEYILAYRNLGIFYENAVNKILADFVKHVKPKWAVVSGEFSPRGGIRSDVKACYGKTHNRSK